MNTILNMYIRDCGVVALGTELIGTAVDVDDDSDTAVCNLDITPDAEVVVDPVAAFVVVVEPVEVSVVAEVIEKALKQ